MTIITDCAKAEQMLQEILQRIESLNCESQSFNTTELIDLMAKIDKRNNQKNIRSNINIARQRFLNGKRRPLYVFDDETRRPERVRSDLNSSSN